MPGTNRKLLTTAFFLAALRTNSVVLETEICFVHDPRTLSKREHKFKNLSNEVRGIPGMRSTFCPAVHGWRRLIGWQASRVLSQAGRVLGILCGRLVTRFRVAVTVWVWCTLKLFQASSVEVFGVMLRTLPCKQKKETDEFPY